ncbi:hypothetical protein BOX15_Mlig026207g2, partial [Macrostomum lignano]
QMRSAVPWLSLMCRRSLRTSSALFKRDYYEVLGLGRQADQKDIKRAYYQLAKKYHPDVNKNDPGAAKKFQEVSEAYEVLSDEAKRRQYDAYGMAGGGSGGPGQSASASGRGSGGFQGGFESYHGSIDPEELFRRIFRDAGFDFSGFNNTDSTTQGFAESVFGFGPAKEVSLRLTFEEAACGAVKAVQVNAVGDCRKCRGSGAEPGSRVVNCPQCNGTGYETLSTGAFYMRSTCRRCGGARRAAATPCTECGGKGRTIQRRNLQIVVPAGVESGQTLRVPLSGVGGGSTEEIWARIEVTPSDRFRRDRADVHSDVEVSISQAVLGGTISVRGLREQLSVNLPPGTNSHDTIRLSGQGIARIGGYGNGDHVVHVKIKSPRRLSQEQRELLLKFAQLEGANDYRGGTVDGVLRSVTAELLSTILRVLADRKLSLFDKLKEIGWHLKKAVLG